MKRVAAFKLLALIFGIVLLFFFLRNIDFQQVKIHITQVGWKFGWLLLVTGLGYFFAALAWYFSFRKIEMKHVFGKLFVYRMIGETLAVINPTSVVAGDAAKIYFLKKNGIPIEEASSSTLISRILLIISLVFLLILTSFFFFNSITIFENDVLKLALLFLLGSLAFGLFYVFVSEKLFLHRISFFLLNLFTNNPQQRGESIYNINLAIVDYYKNHKIKFAFAFLLSVLHWLMGALEFYIILHFLKIPISFLDASMLEMGVILVKALGAFVPGQIGIEEQGNKLMLVVIGVSIAGIWIAVSIFRRARQVFWLLVGTLLYFFNYKKL